MPHISIVLSTGRQATGTSEYTHATRTATTSTSVVRHSGRPIAEATLGTTTEVTHGITDVTSQKDIMENREEATVALHTRECATISTTATMAEARASARTRANRVETATMTCGDRAAHAAL